jgi:hypothetical protein
MRISAAQRIQTENRIRAAMDRLLRGDIPPGGNCDIKTLASQAGVDRTAFYGNRPYAICASSSKTGYNDYRSAARHPTRKRRRSNDSTPRSTSSDTAWRKRTPRSVNSPTSEPGRSRDSPPNTKRSRGSARSPIPTSTSPTYHEHGRRSSAHADAAQSSDVSERAVSVCAGGNATSITAEGG